MDILERLLKHDTWTTRQLLSRCRELTPGQLDQRFDIGQGTLRATLVHLIWNIEAWTDLMIGRPRRAKPAGERAASVDGLIERHEAAAAEFEAFARRIAAEGRLDETWLDVLDNPPQPKTFGSTIAHVITHSLAHRVEVLHMLQRLGLDNLIEGDVLSWELQGKE